MRRTWSICPWSPPPDSRSGTTGEQALYADNLAYMDKQVGQVVQELDRLNLREKTLIVVRRRQRDRGAVSFSDRRPIHSWA